MMSAMYLTLTTTTSDQTKSETAPMTLPAVGRTALGPLKDACNAYSGLVPTSPNTTPSAPSVSAPRCRPAGSLVFNPAHGVAVKTALGRNPFYSSREVDFARDARFARKRHA